MNLISLPFFDQVEQFVRFIERDHDKNISNVEYFIIVGLFLFAITFCFYLLLTIYTGIRSLIDITFSKKVIINGIVKKIYINNNVTIADIDIGENKQIKMIVQYSFIEKVLIDDNIKIEQRIGLLTNEIIDSKFILYEKNVDKK